MRHRTDSNAALTHLSAVQLFISPVTFSGPSGHQNLRILVADDCRVSQLVTSNFLLSYWRVDLLMVKDGEEAIQAASACDFDLILMDIEMPGMSGFEATQRIRHQEQARHAPRRTPVVAYTSLALTANDHRVMACGMDDVVAKPPEAGSMSECFRRWCRSQHFHASSVAPSRRV